MAKKCTDTREINNCKVYPIMFFCIKLGTEACRQHHTDTILNVNFLSFMGDLLSFQFIKDLQRTILCLSEHVMKLKDKTLK